MRGGREATGVSGAGATGTFVERPRPVDGTKDSGSRTHQPGWRMRALAPSPKTRATVSTATFPAMPWRRTAAKKKKREREGEQRPGLAETEDADRAAHLERAPAEGGQGDRCSGGESPAGDPLPGGLPERGAAPRTIRAIAGKAR